MRAILPLIAFSAALVIVPARSEEREPSPPSEPTATSEPSCKTEPQEPCLAVEFTDEGIKPVDDIVQLKRPAPKPPAPHSPQSPDSKLH